MLQYVTLQDLANTFPKCAKNGLLSQERSWSRTWRELYQKEDYFDEKEATSEKQSRATAQTLIDNKEKVIKTYSFDKTHDDLKENIHPRVLLRCPVVSAGALFKLHKHKAHDLFTQLPIDAYDMSHIGLAGQVTPKGWAQAHDLGCVEISLCNFTRENFNKVANNTRQCATIGSTAEGNTYIEHGDASVPISRLPEFMQALNNLMCIRRRVYAYDFSMEPILAYLTQNWFFSGDQHKQYRHDLTPGAFCAQFTEWILRKNAVRYQSGSDFLNLTEINTEFDIFKAQRNPTTHNNQHFKKPNEFAKKCTYFNTGNCYNQTKAECNNGKHLCSANKGKGRTCNMRHPAKDHRYPPKQENTYTSPHKQNDAKPGPSSQRV